MFYRIVTLIDVKQAHRCGHAAKHRLAMALPVRAHAHARTRTARITSAAASHRSKHIYHDISPQVPCHLPVTFYHHLFSHFDISSCAARTLSFSSSVTDCFSLNLPTFQRRHTAPRDAIGWKSSKGVTWLASTNSDVTSGSVIGSFAGFCAF